MRSVLKVAILASIIMAALGYVLSERLSEGAGPLPTEPLPIPDRAQEPEMSSPPAVSTPVTFVPTDPEQVSSDGLSEEERTNIAIYERFSAGVVNITSVSFTYDFFFQPTPQSGSGSGVVLDGDGHIATNYHVIENAVETSFRYQTPPEIEVTLSDQSRHPATVVGIDPSNDLAVIQVEDAGVEWVPIPLGSTADLRVGQKVLAIGNPFGLDRTLTTGIISSLGRSIEATNGRVIEGIIQTDAAINPGNSGGPLLNTRGELIGINTAIVSGASGVGFAVPVNTVRRVTHDLVTYGRVRRAYVVGEENLLDLETLGPDIVNYLDLGTRSGAMLVRVPASSPAADAGLRGATSSIRVRNYRIPANGDVIVQIGSRAVRTSSEIATVLESYRPGDKVDVRLFRDRNPLTVTVTLGEEPGG